MDDPSNARRAAIAVLAVLRAGLIYGEAGRAETWQPSWRGWMRLGRRSRAGHARWASRRALHALSPPPVRRG